MTRIPASQSICPYCGTKLATIPSRKRHCSSCRQVMYVKRGVDDTDYAVTEDEVRIIKRERRKYNESLRNRFFETNKGRSRPLKSCRFELLHTTNTSMIGAIGERIAWYYLFHEGITAHKWGSLEEGGPNWHSYRWLTEEQKHFLKDWEQRGETWVWDFIGIRFGPFQDHYNQKVYLIEIKTSRPGKAKRGLKGNWRGRSRGAISQADLERAKQLCFHLLLINVELAANWECVVTPRELLTETG